MYKVMYIYTYIIYIHTYIKLYIYTGRYDMAMTHHDEESITVPGYVYVDGSHRLLKPKPKIVEWPIIFGTS